VSSQDDLCAVTLKGGAVLCPACALERYPNLVIEDDPPGVTPVFEHDSWASEVSGQCAGCGVDVGSEDV